MVVALLVHFETPTKAKESDLVEIGDADGSQKSDHVILLRRQKPKVGSSTRSFICRQSRRSVPYLVASDSCQNVALYSAEGGIIPWFRPVSR